MYVIYVQKSKSGIFGHPRHPSHTGSPNLNLYGLMTMGTRPGKLTKKELERSTMLYSWVNQLFDWAIFNSFLYVYQRVSHITLI